MAYADRFSEYAKPLTDLTGGRKPTILVWGDVVQQAFETLRRLVCEAPVFIFHFILLCNKQSRQTREIIMEKYKNKNTTEKQ